MTAAGERLAELPRSYSSAGTKPPQDRPFKQSSGSTSDVFGELLAQGGWVVEENRSRQPVAAPMHLSFTRGPFTSITQDAVVTW
ncbi:hypothetical protein ABZ379_00030 [Streptomyces canus]